MHTGHIKGGSEVGQPNLGPAQLKAGKFTHPRHSVRILKDFVFYMPVLVKINVFVKKTCLLSYNF
jgi:hypothetical protein